jgi:DNA-binding NtrC family response regulator
MTTGREDSAIATLVSRFGAAFPEGTFVLRVRGREGPVLVLDGAQGRALVGQSPACELRLDDRTVSRRHAAVELVGTRVRITDLGSTNGTFVNGIAIESAWLRGGETVRVGDTELEVERHAEAPNPEVPFAEGFGRLVGESREMRRLYPLAAKLAAAKVAVVIEGETGTGKEVLAEALHEMGPLADGPFVVFDCTAVPANLVESELFGHERGAFTGAIATRKGVFEQAHGGTLLIDEIGDLEPALQPKLLRALERGEVRRVGGDRPIKVDVRVLSATRRDLDREVQEGRFRDDLFHRLAVTRIELPPLRERRGDVSALARHFWTSLGGAGEPPAELLSRWEAWSWPGNVRELRNAVARALALGVEDAPPPVAPTPPPSGNATLLDRLLAARTPYVQARAAILDEFERRYVEQVLADAGGVVTKAAAASGIARRHFQRIRARGKSDG